MKPDYPEKLWKLIDAAAVREKLTGPNASGRAAAFTCGVTVEFVLNIDEESKTVAEASFSTNGCGFVLGVAELLAEGITGCRLVKLEGLSVLEDFVSSKIGQPPVGRYHCFNLCFDALQNALSDFRSKTVAEWNGDEELICSCFGVSDTQIEEVVSSKRLVTVEEVGDALNAGTGCGSCQPLIQDIISEDGR